MAVRIFLTRTSQQRSRVSHLERIMAALVFITAQLHSLGQTGFDEYATSSLESRTIDLHCKSNMTLKEQSHVIVRNTQHSLRIRVLSGEALISLDEVSPKPTSVRAGYAQIDATTTTFDINVAGDKTSVSILRGSATLSTLNPVAGSQRGTRLPLRAGDRVQVIRVGTQVMLRLQP